MARRQIWGWCAGYFGMMVAIGALLWPLMVHPLFASFYVAEVMVFGWALWRIMPWARVRAGMLEVKHGRRVLRWRWKRGAIAEITRLEVSGDRYVVWFGRRSLGFSRRFGSVARELESATGLRFS